jgi:hypothetical protein
MEDIAQKAPDTWSPRRMSFHGSLKNLEGLELPYNESPVQLEVLQCVEVTIFSEALGD